MIQTNIEFPHILSSGSHVDTWEHTDRGTMDMMEVTCAVCDYVNMPKNQTQYAACIHTNMTLDLKTNSTANARLVSVHLQKFLGSIRILRIAQRTSQQHAQKTIQTQYRNHIHDKLLTDMLLTALQEMQHNSNITTAVHTTTTQNVQSLAESRFIRKNK